MTCWFVWIQNITLRICITAQSLCKYNLQRKKTVHYLCFPWLFLWPCICYFQKIIVSNNKPQPLGYYYYIWQKHYRPSSSYGLFSLFYVLLLLLTNISFSILSYSNLNQLSKALYCLNMFIQGSLGIS